MAFDAFPGGDYASMSIPYQEVVRSEAAPLNALYRALLEEEGDEGG